VHILGALSSIDIPVSGFRLHPLVAVARTRPLLAPADGEVARILDVKISELCDGAHRTSITLVRDGHTIVAPAFAVGGATVWGATAMVLAEFLVLLDCTLELGDPGSVR